MIVFEGVIDALNREKDRVELLKPCVNMKIERRLSLPQMIIRQKCGVTSVEGDPDHETQPRIDMLLA